MSLFRKGPESGPAKDQSEARRGRDFVENSQGERFRPSERVGLRQPDGTVESGYKVRSITDANDCSLIKYDKKGNEIAVFGPFSAEQLISEEKELPFALGSKVKVRRSDPKTGKLEDGWEIYDKDPATNWYIVVNKARKIQKTVSPETLAEWQKREK